MATLKAISLFLLGTLAGLGAACAAVGALLPDSALQLQRLGSVTTALAGMWLVAVGLLGGIGVARGRQTWRLRTALGTIAMLAGLLGLTIGIRQRAERFAGLAAQQKGQGQKTLARIDDMNRQGRAAGELTALYQQSHWHDLMWARFDRASARPWLSVPSFVPCTCRICTAPPSSPSDGS